MLGKVTKVVSRKKKYLKRPQIGCKTNKHNDHDHDDDDDHKKKNILVEYTNSYSTAHVRKSADRTKPTYVGYTSRKCRSNEEEKNLKI